MAKTVGRGWRHPWSGHGIGDNGKNSPRFIKVDITPLFLYIPHPNTLKTEKKQGDINMDPIGKWEFGITMMVGGMGGTLLMLWILSFVITLLKKIFPLSKDLDKAE